MSRRSIIAALAAVALVLAPASAVAAGNAGSTFVFTEPVEATLDACPDLPAGLVVDFSGTAHVHVHESVDANGVIHVNVVETITGTAVDSEGATYRFNYHQALTVRDRGLPIEFTVTDHFSLVGNGGANRLRTFFVWKFAITETGVEDAVFRVHGDPELCDPL